jgi:Flp pilus assembly secretin CpaC
MKGPHGAHGRKLVAAAVASFLAVAAAHAAPANGMLDVTIDFAKVLSFDEPFQDIIIGSPGIANATARDDTSVVLTGRAAGTTNLILLNDDGEEIANYTVRVSSDVQQLTTVFYGPNRQTFSCAPTCEQVVSVGDDPAKFTAATAQITERQSFVDRQ